MAFNRSGECNRCGQCCGASGSPEQRNPWPGYWPSAFRTWSLDDINVSWPQSTMLGVTQLGEDLIGVETPTGFYRVQGIPYYYVWVPGHAVCKDTSVAHDGSSYSLECPFLKDDPGDGTRPCALVGTQDDGAFKKACDDGIPPLVKDTQAEVDQWFQRHPLCSFIYEAE